MTCPYCKRATTQGPCARDGEACSHDCVCAEHGRVGIQSWNMAIAQKEHDKVYGAKKADLPLFMESA